MRWGKGRPWLEEYRPAACFALRSGIRQLPDRHSDVSPTRWLLEEPFLDPGRLSPVSLMRGLFALISL